MGIIELEANLEQSRRDLFELERRLAVRRKELARQEKLLELLKKVRALKVAPDVQEFMDLAEDVGL